MQDERSKAVRLLLGWTAALFAGSGVGGRVLAQPPPEASPKLELTLQLHYVGAEQSYRLEGELAFQRPLPSSGASSSSSSSAATAPAAAPVSHCFYLPLQDPNPAPGYEPLRYLRRYVQAPEPEVVAASAPLGVTAVTAPAAGLLELSPFVLRVRGPAQATVKLQFRSRIPALPQQDQLFAGFHPVPLRRCPGQAEAADSRLVRALQVKSRVRAQVSARELAGLQILGPGLEAMPLASAASSGAEARVPAPKLSVYSEQLAFFVGRGLHQERLEVAGTRLLLFLRAPLHPALRHTLEAAFLSHSQWFGPYPYRDLTLIESSLLHRADLPGLLVINQPRQYFFTALQENYLNWKHWVLANLLAAQWYGSAISVAAEKDTWFLAGVCDFATLMFLQSEASRFDLFNHYDGNFNLLSLNYAQIQDLTASVLFRDQPLAALTDVRLHSLKNAAAESPLLFIKQALTLKYLRFAMGSDSFQNFLRLFTQRQLFKTVTPKAFHAALRSYPYQAQKTSKQKAADYLQSLWTQRGWPDYSVTAFHKKKLANGKWLAEATVSATGPLNLPTQLQFADKAGKNYLLTSEPPAAQDPPAAATLELSVPAALRPTAAHSSWKVAAVTENEPSDVTIDPFHHLFDSDRFDNQASAPAIKIFPLGTNTLSDRAYTSVWFPYIFRRPGERTSVAVQTALLKYLHSGLFAKVEVEPSAQRLAYQGRWEWVHPERAALSHLSVARSYASFHVAEALHSKRLLAEQNLAVRFALRYRLALGQAGSGHPTLAAGLFAGEAKAGVGCDWTASADWEYAPLVASAVYHYSRQVGTVALGCTSRQKIRYTLRHFQGFLRTFRVQPPPMAQFRINQLDEAGVRLDEGGLPLLTRLASFNQDLFLPLSLPFDESSVFLTQKLQLRLFYDRGFNSWHAMRAYESAGLGFVLPLGGDVVGMGPLTLSRFSFSTILYSKKNQELSRRPHFLFDLSGEF